MRLVDFHVHIDYYKNYNEIYKFYDENEIYALFVTNFPEVYGKCRENFKKSKYVKLALGYNPQISSTKKFNYKMFDKYISSTKYIGEVGLDFSKEFISTKNYQRKVFDYICCKASKNNKIISIHSKNATNETLSIMDKNNVKYAIFHWYTGNLDDIEKIVDRGYYFSVNQAMLKNQNGRKIISSIPFDRIIYETDGPFTKYKNKIMEPDKIKCAYKLFEDILDIKNFDKLVYSNVMTLLSQNSKDYKVQ